MKSAVPVIFWLPFLAVFSSCSDHDKTAADTTTPAESAAASSADSAAADRAPWLVEFQSLATGDHAPDALAVFEDLKTNQPEQLTSENLLKMAVYAIEVAKSIELTQPILDYAMTTYPREIGKFGGIDAAIFRLQNPSVAELPIDGAHAPIEGTAGSEADGTQE
jgi:hypothetical protein